MKWLHMHAPIASSGGKRIDSLLNELTEHNPDLVVITGLGLLQDAEALALSRVIQEAPWETLLVPGATAEVLTWGKLFGRRYRLEEASPYLDRWVRVGGQPVMLVDTSWGPITEHQLLWLESLLADNAAERKITVFSSTPLLEGTENTAFRKRLEKIVFSERNPGISLFSGDRIPDDGLRVIEIS